MVDENFRKKYVPESLHNLSFVKVANIDNVLMEGKVAKRRALCSADRNKFYYMILDKVDGNFMPFRKNEEAN